MKLTPEINFTFEFTQDELKLLLDAIIKQSMRDDEWETSPLCNFNEKLALACAYGDSAITFTLSEAKELMEDIADAGLCDEFNELWSELWNTLKSY